MSQAGVQSFFDSHPNGWYHSTDISEWLGIPLGRVNSGLLIMTKHGEIERRISTRKARAFEYRMVC